MRLGILFIFFTVPLVGAPGCSGSDPAPTTGASSSIEKEPSPPITDESILALEDDALIDKVLEVMPPVVRRPTVDDPRTYDFSRHTAGQRWFYCIYDFDHHVLLDGFGGFFSNTRGQITEDVLEGLQAFKADEQRELLVRAIQVRHAKSKLQEIDSLYYALDNDIKLSLARYVRSHPEEFFDRRR